MARLRSNRPSRPRPFRPPSARQTAQLEALRAAVMARYDLFAAELAAKQAAALPEDTAATSHPGQNSSETVI